MLAAAAAGRGAAAGALVLADPRHELRAARRAARRAATAAGAALRRQPRRHRAAAYGVAARAVVAAPTARPTTRCCSPGAGCTHLALLPLPRGDRAVGRVQRRRARRPCRPFAALEPAWLDASPARCWPRASSGCSQRARLLRAGVVDPLTGWNSTHYLHGAAARAGGARCQRHGEPRDAASSSTSIASRRSTSATACTAGDRGPARNRQRASRRRCARAMRFAHLGDDEFAVMLPATARDARGAARRADSRAPCAQRRSPRRPAVA